MIAPGGNGNGSHAGDGKAGEKTGSPLVPQPHGGSIYQGTPATIVPGPGRPPSRIKSALRNDFDVRRSILNDIADGVVRIRLVGRCAQCGHEDDEPVTEGEALLEAMAQAPKPAERIKALEVIGKFSDLDAGKIDHDLIEELGNAVMAEVGDPETVRRIRQRWVESVARRIADG